jgi:hypothetical protein
MYVLVCGDRNWHNFVLPRQILKDLLKHDPFITVIHGDCRGADKICGYIAHQLGMTVIPEPANWNVGYRAGPSRNQYMLDKYNIDVVVAFHNDLSKSKGTKDMVDRAKKAKIPIILVSETKVENIVDVQTKL